MHESIRGRVGHAMHIACGLHGLSETTARLCIADLDVDAIEDAAGYALDRNDCEGLAYAFGWIAAWAQCHDQTCEQVVNEALEDPNQ